LTAAAFASATSVLTRASRNATAILTVVVAAAAGLAAVRRLAGSKTIFEVNCPSCPSPFANGRAQPTGGFARTGYRP
jgi:hypothetical protein